MDAAQVQKLFEPLWSDLTPEVQFNVKKPLLAHYTTLSTLEMIAKSNELWLSNPLYMNDLEEVHFGVINGLNIVRESVAIRNAINNDGNYRQFLLALDDHFRQFDTEHLINTYVFCTSEHDRANTDGMLSQWRAYGANGNGAALLFDTANLSPIPGSGPMILAQVFYGTGQQRLDWLTTMTGNAAAIIAANNFQLADLPLIAAAIFDRIKLFALFTKHAGFSEEREWRIVYVPERDFDGKYKGMFHYHNGPRGIEPKLKFPMTPIPGVTSDDLSLKKLVATVLLGPTTSSPLALAAVKRMLIDAQQPELSERVVVSSIPLRPS